MFDKFTISSNTKVTLKDFSPTETNKLDKKDIQEKYSDLQDKFIELQEVFSASKKFSLLIILQGMDCSGKDGTVKKALAGVNPNGFVVQSYKQPTPEELGHDYLWRAHKAAPIKGNIRSYSSSLEVSLPMTFIPSSPCEIKEINSRIIKIHHPIDSKMSSGTIKV